MNHSHPHSHDANAKDPVCQMSVAVSESAIQSRHHGQDYYFCSQTCKEMFDRDPGRYVH
ncbi:MAG: YHS domain-containing protein [Thermaerobacter sp.]|nr:YHS domain-containing protein [Thermaerobacter sp.]